jgi:hypothetical protein
MTQSLTSRDAILSMKNYQINQKNYRCNELVTAVVTNCTDRAYVMGTSSLGDE